MTPAGAKRKGRATESLLVGWLRNNGVPYAERRRLAGSLDRGDISGIPGVCIEVKSGGRLDLSGWMAELAIEMVNDGATYGLLVIRPKGKPDPAQWWVVMSLGQAIDLLVDGSVEPS